jgi:hypothetical protein
MLAPVGKERDEILIHTNSDDMSCGVAKLRDAQADFDDFGGLKSGCDGVKDRLMAVQDTCESVSSRIGVGDTHMLDMQQNGRDRCSRSGVGDTCAANLGETYAIHDSACDNLADVDDGVKSISGVAGTTHMLEMQQNSRDSCSNNCRKDSLLSSKNIISDCDDDADMGRDGKRAREGTCTISKLDKDTATRLQQLNSQLQALEIKLSGARANLEVVKLRSPRCVGGTLVLVDLAGNEYAGDEKEGRSIRDVKEAKEINQSLLSLKECVRGMHAGMRCVYVCVCVGEFVLYEIGVCIM